jgi:SAM-dependent methyltransferase
VIDRFPAWFAALEARHLEALEFREVRKALQALSSLYVQRRGRIAEGAALDSAGKRAAFALFYGPLHFLTVRGIVRGLGAAVPPPRRVLDLGCGTGAAGAAWASECDPPAVVEGVDVNGWAASEARWTYARLGLEGASRRGGLERAALGGRDTAVVSAFTVNELEASSRDALRGRLLARGGPVLIVEPLARGITPWWDDWAAVFAGAGGRADEWRLPADLPEKLRLLDRAAGLDHRQLTARSLYLPAA